LWQSGANPPRCVRRHGHPGGLQYVGPMGPSGFGGGLMGSLSNLASKQGKKLAEKGKALAEKAKVEAIKQAKILAEKAKVEAKKQAKILAEKAKAEATKQAKILAEKAKMQVEMAKEEATKKINNLIEMEIPNQENMDSSAFGGGLMGSLSGLMSTRGKKLADQAKILIEKAKVEATKQTKILAEKAKKQAQKAKMEATKQLKKMAENVEMEASNQLNKNEQMNLDNAPAFGKKKKMYRPKRKVKLPLKLRKLCRKLKIRVTKKVGGHRVYKSVKDLNKIIKIKMKKLNR
jgi:hypothetical protein